MSFHRLFSLLLVTIIQKVIISVLANNNNLINKKNKNYLSKNMKH